jgi:hypothetical protein
VLCAGGVALGIFVVVPLALGNVVYTSALSCMGDERPDPYSPDEVSTLELRESEDATIPRPDGPHTLLLESHGASFTRAGSTRASMGYQTHGCGGGSETVHALGDGMLQVSIWSYGEGAR